MGLRALPEGKILCRHRRKWFIVQLEGLQKRLTDQHDLFGYSYQYSFTEGPRAGSKCGGGISGFRIHGLTGHISVKPSGYCTVVLMEDAPTGRGRIVQILDMRNQETMQTDDWGVLKIYRRKATVGWFEHLPKAIDWLGQQTTEEVDILHR
jgi:hypothetical protein